MCNTPLPCSKRKLNYRWRDLSFRRGVPLITVLFMFSVMLPIFIPEEVTIDKLLRAIICIIFFESA